MPKRFMNDRCVQVCFLATAIAMFFLAVELQAFGQSKGKSSPPPPPPKTNIFKPPPPPTTNKLPTTTSKLPTTTSKPPTTIGKPLFVPNQEETVSKPKSPVIFSGNTGAKGSSAGNKSAQIAVNQQGKPIVIKAGQIKRGFGLTEPIPGTRPASPGQTLAGPGKPSFPTPGPGAPTNTVRIPNEVIAGLGNLFQPRPGGAPAPGVAPKQFPGEQVPIQTQPGFVQPAPIPVAQIATEPVNALRITSVYDGTGKQAGIQADNIILAIGSKRVKSFDQFVATLKGIQGESNLIYYDVQKDQLAQMRVRVEDGRIGIGVEEVFVDIEGDTDDIGGPAPQTGGVNAAASGPSGLRITELQRGPAGRAGLQVGDVILGLNGRPVQSVADLEAALASEQNLDILFFNPDDRKAETRRVAVQNASIGVKVEVVGVSSN